MWPALKITSAGLAWTKVPKPEPFPKNAVPSAPGAWEGQEGELVAKIVGLDELISFLSSTINILCELEQVPSLTVPIL